LFFWSSYRISAESVFRKCNSRSRFDLVGQAKLSIGSRRFRVDASVRSARILNETIDISLWRTSKGHWGFYSDRSRRDRFQNRLPGLQMDLLRPKQSKHASVVSAKCSKILFCPPVFFFKTVISPDRVILPPRTVIKGSRSFLYLLTFP
jgi:hypothetical protein